MNWLNFIAVPVDWQNSQSVQTFEIIYWLMFVVAFIPYIFVIVIRILIYAYTVQNGETKAANLVDRFQDKIHSVLWFLVNALYFPVIGTMIAGTDCTYYRDDQGGIVLDASTSIKCLRGNHIAILVASMLALIIYYPAASFAQAQTLSISDIKFKPRIVFVMLQGKFLLVLLAEYFTKADSYILYYTAVSIIHAIFLGINIIGQPCLVGWVNRMRTILFTLTLWATFCAIISTFVLINSVIPAILLLTVWAAMLIGFPTFFYLWDRLNNRKEVDLSSL